MSCQSYYLCLHYSVPHGESTKLRYFCLLKLQHQCEPIVSKLSGPEGVSTDTISIEKLWEPSSAMSSTMVKDSSIVLPLVDPAGNVSVELGRR